MGITCGPIRPAGSITAVVTIPLDLEPSRVRGPDSQRFEFDGSLRLVVHGLPDVQQRATTSTGGPILVVGVQCEPVAASAGPGADRWTVRRQCRSGSTQRTDAPTPPGSGSAPPHPPPRASSPVSDAPPLHAVAPAEQDPSPQMVPSTP